MVQRYERIQANADDDDDYSNTSPTSASQQHLQTAIPASPPPSFHSRASSPTAASRRRESERLIASEDPLHDQDSATRDRELADAFDDSDSEDEDDRQRLMRGQPESASAEGEASRPGAVQRQVTELPVFVPNGGSGMGGGAVARTGKVYGGGQNDGVWANLSAKPTRGEDVEEKPPSYEQAAADATPPYWETTILAPGFTGDEVFLDGLPVGSIFSFVWNAMIVMSFDFVGFLLTYLLHSTHAAKNGSRAGLGLTLVQKGFQFKFSSSSATVSDPPSDFDVPSNGGSGGTVPSDPNSHDFDPSGVAGGAGGAGGGAVEAGISNGDLLAYALMIVGWFILIKAISDFVRARRHEQLVLQSPERNLGVVPVVAEGESPERTV